jgi:hypothetical protein
MDFLLRFLSAVSPSLACWLGREVTRTLKDDENPLKDLPGSKFRARTMNPVKALVDVMSFPE